MKYLWLIYGHLCSKKHHKLNSDLTIMKFLKDLKTWKTIIQFIITVLTAIISSFFVQSCIA